MKRLSILLFVALLLTSCVSMNNYRQTKSRMLSLELQKNELTTQIAALVARNSTLESEWVRLNSEFKKLNDELQKLKKEDEKVQKNTVKTER